MADCMTCGNNQNRTGAKHCGVCGARLSFLAPGEVLHQRYKIISLLGKGGMGAVCLVEDQHAFGKRCVVKELIDYFNPSDPVEVAKARQRFEDEARTLASLDHPSIPDVRDYFSDGGRNYMVMEYVEGENLHDRLLREGRPLQQDEALQYAIQVCRVLEYLSVRQPPLVHHDIKPANVVVNREAKTVSLVDFGTAKVRFVQGGGTLGQSQSSVYGTIGYAPPEQYGDDPQTEPRSDVYALAATVYQLLTVDDPGDHPMSFPALTTLAIPTRQALERALEPKVAQRINATQFREALEKVLAPRPTVQPYVFPSGAKAQTAEDLAQLCDREWPSARDLLHRNSFESWLRTNLFRSDLALAAGQLSGQSDKDVALEAFVHVLDPKIPGAAPKLDPAIVNFGTLKAGRQDTRQLRITNQAPRGHLAGKITVTPESRWLGISSASFSGNNTAFTLTVNTTGLAQGTRLGTQLVVTTPYAPPVSVQVKARVELAWTTFLGTWLLFIFMGVLLGGGASWLTGQLATRGYAPDLQIYALAAYGVLTLATAIGLGIAVGSPEAFSRAGFFIGALTALPVISYLLIGMSIQFRALYTGSVDLLAYGSTAAVIALPALLLGLFAGLRKIHRKGLAVILPLALLAGLVGWVMQGTSLAAGMGQVRVLGLPGTPYAYPLPEPLPFFYVQPAGMHIEPVLVTEEHEPTPTVFSTPTSSRPPSSTPILAADAISDILVGGRVKVVNTNRRGLKVRASPSTTAAIRRSVVEGAILEVIGGPETGSGYTWWQVKQGTITGWVAQNWLKSVP